MLVHGISGHMLYVYNILITLFLSTNSKQNEIYNSDQVLLITITTPADGLESINIAIYFKVVHYLIILLAIVYFKLLDNNCILRLARN